jgi:hypothetical protein
MNSKPTHLHKPSAHTEEYDLIGPNLRDEISQIAASNTILANMDPVETRRFIEYFTDTIRHGKRLCKI